MRTFMVAKHTTTRNPFRAGLQNEKGDQLLIAPYPKKSVF